ncbi:hypothetical protein [Bradyrhizobium sp. USDA 10063]
MKTLTISSSDLAKTARLDAYFHLSEGRLLARRVGQMAIKYSRLGHPDGLKARVWAPARFKRVYAMPGEEELPYLRPSDTLNYTFRAADMLSATRNENIDEYRLQGGMILVTCSGRNLGPAVYVDTCMAQFVLSHDMIRVEIEDETLRFYVLGLLGTRIGQHLLRKDKSGSVIDHITVEHVASLEVPMLPDRTIADIADKMKQAVQLRESSRLHLCEQQKLYEATLPPIDSGQPIPRRWTISSQEISDRLDAAPYEPAVLSTRRELMARGGPLLGDIAKALKPSGRYKTNYVGADHGIPILSGGQLLQIRPLNLRYIAPRALTDVDRYRLEAGWIAYQADGRSEEALGEPVMITNDRKGWLASGHVGRIVANKASDAGSLYLAFQSPHAQMQLKAFASGSVVDATFPIDAERVVLPPLPIGMSRDIQESWVRFGVAQSIEDDVFKSIQDDLHELMRS